MTKTIWKRKHLIVDLVTVSETEFSTSVLGGTGAAGIQALMRGEGGLILRLGLAWSSETLKPTPRDIPPTKPYLLILLPTWDQSFKHMSSFSFK